ncbi:ABC transporter permease, partial [bacterium]|nr:ABC transporter permease [bacterium]
MSLFFLAAQNLRRNVLRSLLTIVGVAVAIIAFVLLRTVIWAWTVGVDESTIERVVTRHKVTFVMSLPKKYVSMIKERVPGVKAVTWANWFGGKEPNHEHDFFQMLAVDHTTFFEVYDEMKVPPEQLAAWKSDRQGLIVGEVLAKKFNWKVGDSVTLTSQIFKGEWKFNVSGLYVATRKTVDKSTILFHWEYFNDSMPERAKDQIGWITARVADSKAAIATAQAIDKMFDQEDTQTLSQDEQTFNKSFMAMFSEILKALNIVSLVILGIMMLILGNTVAMGVRERISEHAVLRAIGFLPHHLAALVVLEAGAL